MVPSKEGLSVSMDVSILYRLDPGKAAEIYKTVGVDYPDVVIIPQTRSVIRGVTVNHEAKALYTSEREVVSDAISEELGPMLESRGILLEKVLLRGITLPEMVSTAIESKLSAEQDAEKMKFLLEREKIEADRKRTEAQGISDSNKIIGQSLTPNYLKWYWISNLGKANSVIYVPVETMGCLSSRMSTRPQLGQRLCLRYLAVHHLDRLMKVPNSGFVGLGGSPLL